MSEQHKVAPLNSQVSAAAPALATAPVVFEQPSHTSRTLSQDCVGELVSIAGFANTVRDHGEVIFVDVRDAFGQCQVLLSPEFGREAFEAAQHLKHESTVLVQGRVRIRPAGTENPEQKLGHLEITATHFGVLGKALPLPFPLDEAQNVHEHVLLRYRYLQLRTDRLQRNLKLRSEVVRALREGFYESEFQEIETPTLFKSTPEGSRDFLVPSRLHPGQFFALVQSPQMLKQLLIVGGISRYMQLTKCYRDEDQRADRQPEFTQLDLEASFLTQNAFMEIAEKNFLAALTTLKLKAMSASVLSDTVPLPTQIPRIKHDDALEHFGSDKPDLRFALPLLDASEILKNTGFETFRTLVERKGMVKYLCLPASHSATDLPRSFLDTLPVFAKAFGSQGLAWIRVQADGSWQGPAGKFFSEPEKQALLAQACRKNPHLSHLSLGGASAPASPPKSSELNLSDLGEGTMLFFCASLDPNVVYKTLGALRLKLAEVCALPLAKLALTWVVDWPLFEWDAKTKSAQAAHHPFTAPANASIADFLSASRAGFTSANVGQIRAQAFDLVCNGAEIGGGSARIYSPQVQAHMFSLLGMSPEKIEKQFGFFIEALQYGTPPHVGMAFGIDRIVALLAGENSIRDVIAFPKTGSGACLMSNSPTPVENQQMSEVGIALRTDK